MTMIGMNRTQGLALDGTEHIRQSITDILTTPIGSRVMRRSYGSYLFDLVDQPANEANLLLLMAASVHALMLWEPRVSLINVGVEMSDEGKVLVSFDCILNENGQQLYIDWIQVGQ